MNNDNAEGLKPQLLALLKKEAFKKGDFILSSGKHSSYYLDGRVITLTPEGAYLAGRIFLEKLKNKKADAVGGPTLGADPIVGAIAALSHQYQIPLTAFIVRKTAKEHGMQRQIEGPQLKKGSRVVLVDDVATTGKSLIEAKRLLEAYSVGVDCAMVIVDRLEGASENLSAAGLKLESIFTVKDLGVDA